MSEIETTVLKTGPEEEIDKVIETVVPWIEKRINEETKLGKLSFDISKKFKNEEKSLDLALRETNILNKLAPHLESLGLRVQRNKDPQDANYEILSVSWIEEEEQRFDVSQEEEERLEEEHEEETEPRAPKAPVGAAPVRQQQDQQTGRPRHIGARLRIQPRPPDIKQVELGPIQNLRMLLENIPLQRLAYENWIRKRLVLVGNNQPLERALSRINKHNILSLPVVDVNSPVGAVIGLLDVLDIVSTVSEAIETAKRPRRELLMIPISSIMSKEGRSPTYLISTQSTLYHAIYQFSQTGLPRAMIVDRPLPNGNMVVEQTNPEDRVVGLLTQSDILRFLAENFMWMKRESIFRHTLEELGLGKRKPFTVDQSMPAYKAFMEIHRQGRDGVAMVDSSGKIIANLSASNIKGMTRTNFQLVFRPLTVYLSRDRKRGWWQLPVCTTLDTTLEHVILQFVSTKVHRMYIVDAEGKPTGEVNLTDIMQQLHVL